MIADSHGPKPEKMQFEIANGALTPILISQAAIYPGGRMQNILIKGIDPAQGILRIPSEKLKTDITDIEEIPAIKGKLS